MILGHEVQSAFNASCLDLDDLRRELGVDPEPMIDAAERDIGQLPIATLHRVRLDNLTVPQLSSLFDRASDFALHGAATRSAKAIVERQPRPDEFDVECVYGNLIDLDKSLGNREGAERWLAEARRFDERSGRPPRLFWDITEWNLSFVFDPISDWGPGLAQLYRRCESDPAAARELYLTLVQVGILRMVQDPSDPKKVMLDTRMLEQIVTRYAGSTSKVLDLSPVGGQPGKIWLPGDTLPSTSGIATAASEAGSKPRSKLVIPGS
jgi:hypothetical protein